MILSPSCKFAVSMGYSARFGRLLVSDLIGFLSTTQSISFQCSLLFSCLFLICNATDTHLLVSTKVSLGVDWFGGTFGVY
uniref:Putative ovule protein n=1 Tax=Solanum chacoense TaxID=4108 RepID=A0A0V0HJE3_SOLCH